MTGSTDGIHVSGHATVNGPMAAGAHASAVSYGSDPQTVPAVDPSAALAALTAAVETLRTDLSRLRATEPEAVPEGDADDASRALAEAAAEASAAQPRAGVLRRRIRAATDALGGVTGLVTAVAALEVAAEPVIHSLGG
jgi:hypothetical protein